MINKKYLFIWNKHVIKYYELDKDITDKQNMRLLEFRIDNVTHSQYLKEIRTGSNPDLIVIIAGTTYNQLDHSDSIFIWDVKNDRENETYDVRGTYEILWDKDGNPYIVVGKEVIFPKERCTIKAFHFQNF